MDRLADDGCPNHEEPMSPASDEAVMDLKLRLERAERLLAQTHRSLRACLTAADLYAIDTSRREAAEAIRENERHYPTLGM